MRTLRDWKPGDNVFKNAHHQQAVEALRELDGLPAYGVPPREYVLLEAWPGKVVAEGPAGAGDPDWADERYWVQKIYLRGTTLPTDNLIFGEDKGADPNAGATNTIVTAVNLPEIPAGTHEIPTDGSYVVWVSAYQDYGNPSFKRYVFSHGSAALPEVALLRINTHEGTGGQYGVKVYDVGEYSPDGAGNLILPEGVTTADVLGLALNQDEQGQPTHWIPTGTYVWGFLLAGISTEAIPKPVYGIIRGQYLGAAVPGDIQDGDLSPLSAGSLIDFQSGDTSWWENRELFGADRTGPVSFPVLVGLFDNRAGDGKFYFKFREISVETDGRVGFVGQATDLSFTIT